MEYIEDKEFKYSHEINKNLSDYNYKYTGEKESSVEYFYVVNDNKLVGAIYAYLDWDWVDLDSIYYDNIETLKKLILSIRHYYINRAVGLKVLTEVESVKKVFEKIGFSLVGSVEGTKKTKRIYQVASSDFSLQGYNRNDVIVSTEKIDEYDLIVQKEIEKIDKENNIMDYPSKPLMVVALDGDKFAGGIQVNITEDKMYINKIVVKKEYRSLKVGSMLLKIVEEKAKDLGIYSISLGTTEFQAKGFYEKQGYKVALTKENEPVGFKSYKMIKRL